MFLVFMKDREDGDYDNLAAVHLNAVSDEFVSVILSHLHYQFPEDHITTTVIENIEATTLLDVFIKPAK